MHGVERARLVAGLVIALAACSRADTRSGDNQAEESDQAITDLRYDRSLLLETTSETSANVSIGDVDGDGKLDRVPGHSISPVEVYDASKNQLRVETFGGGSIAYLSMKRGRAVNAHLGRREFPTSP